MHYEGDSSQTLIAGLMVNLPQCKVETSVVGDCHEVTSSLIDKHEVLLSPCFETELIIL